MVSIIRTKVDTTRMSLEDISNLAKNEGGGIKDSKYIKAHSQTTKSLFTSGIGGALIKFAANIGIKRARDYRHEQREHGVHLLKQKFDKEFGPGIGQRVFDHFATGKHGHYNRKGVKNADFSEGVMIGDLEKLIFQATKLRNEDIEQRLKAGEFRINIPELPKQNLAIEPQTKNNVDLTSNNEIEIDELDTILQTHKTQNDDQIESTTTNQYVESFIENWKPPETVSTIDEKTLDYLLNETISKKVEATPNEILKEIVSNAEETVDYQPDNLDALLQNTKLNSSIGVDTDLIPNEDLESLLNDLENDEIDESDDDDFLSEKDDVQSKNSPNLDRLVTPEMREMQNRNLRESDVHDLERAIQEAEHDAMINPTRSRFQSIIDFE